MDEQKNFELELPKQNDLGQRASAGTSRSFIFIGANGSGKTRLGVWIEDNNDDKAHRISAQKSLNMPKEVTLVSIDTSRVDLVRGNSSHSNIKYTARWGENPATHLLDDFNKLLKYLLSENSQKSTEFRNEAIEAMKTKNTFENITLPEAKIDKLKKLWEKVITHRELIINNASIETRSRSGSKSKYNSSEMSDGERVIFYLIGQALSAPEDGIIIIDEPELHLHKSIQAPLWTAIEQLRPDCLFIYFTHDMDFASSHQSAQKIWVKSFDGKSWDWEIIEGMSEGEIPQELLMEILGNRKPVVFVEGTKGSIDFNFYQALLKDCLVKPSGSCSQVIQYTKAFRARKDMHNLNVYGIVDRDRRPCKNIEELKSNGVYTLQVAEVENLFCDKEILSIICSHLKKDENMINNAVSSIWEFFKNEFNSQVMLRVKEEVSEKLKECNIKSKDIEGIKQEVVRQTDINVDLIYENNNKMFSEIIESKNYSKLLEVYNQKGLANRISHIFGLGNSELPLFVIRMAKEDMHEQIKKAVAPYFGGFFEVIKNEKKNNGDL